MVKGKLQVEGEVIQVVVICCYVFSKLFRQLTPSNNENLPVLTLAYPDEKDGQGKIFPGAGNLDKIIAGQIYGLLYNGAINLGASFIASITRVKLSLNNLWLEYAIGNM